MEGLSDRPVSFQYLGSRRVGNAIWLRIRLAAKGPCDQTYENVTDVEGWIPAGAESRLLVQPLIA